MKKRSFLLVLVLISIISCKTEKKQEVHNVTQQKSEIIASANEAIVETTSGKVAGYIDDGVYIYKGIPYAESERFMPPQKPNSWDGIRSCRAYGPVCPQGKRMGWYSDEQAFAFDWDDGFADENCQRINIWTKGINDGVKRPVMVWLHGGGYTAGSGQELPSYDGSSLCQKGDVVIVTLNHRLNVLGFLDLSAFGEKYASSGNAGMLDLVFALQWVQSNIANFGGDPSNVTIFGQSGGGGKVSTLLSMPMAQGLFHKAIVQSGSLLNTMEAKYSRRIGTIVMEELNLKASQIDELKRIPYEQLLEAGNKAIAKVKEEAVKDGFNPFIFGWSPSVGGSILPHQPSDVKSFELSKSIPLLVGTTLHEFTASTYNPKLRNVDLSFAKDELLKKYGDKTDEFLKAFEKAYPGYKPQDLFDVDFIFRPGAVKQAAMKSGLKGAPVYLYLFTWQSPVLDGAFRSTHCMELPFVFNNIDRCRAMTGGTKEAYTLANTMSSAWISFARTGNPNTKDLPEWQPYSTESGATMFFDTSCEVKHNHDKELLDVVSSFPIRGF